MRDTRVVPPDCSDRTLPESDRRELIVWSVRCAERVLPIFESEAPDDPRLHDALNGALAFSHGKLGIGEVRKLAFDCHAAARDADGAAATAAARMCGQAVAVAHMAGHSREVARYTAKALASEPEVRDNELAWQREQLPTRFATYVYPA